MTRDTLNDLAERCERATGPDRELDAAIFCAFPHAGVRSCTPAKKPGAVTALYEIGGYAAFQSPLYTASLDAAMTLVPEGWHKAFNSQVGGAWVWPSGAEYLDAINDPRATRGTAATPALALCAAALRSLAGKEDG
jgi:hypothetical protein